MFHYTTLDALKSILVKKQLWLSHYRYMNDHQEFFYIFNKAKDEILNKSTSAVLSEGGFKGIVQLNREKLMQRHRDSGNAEDDLIRIVNKNNFYIASFCKSGSDLLSQWRGYTSGNIGYCIEFDENKLKNIPHTAIVDCEYDEEKINQNMDELLKKYDFTDSKQVVEWINSLLAICIASKHHSFKEENEKRIVVMTSKIEIKPSFNCKQGILVPYVPITFDETAIKSIRIGPTNNQELCKKSLGMFLESLGYNHVNIELSDTPLRN
jgi:hypothetical protein